MNPVERKLLPTDPYNQLLAATIDRAKLINDQTSTRSEEETFELPKGIERDIKMVIIIKMEIINRLVDWPFNLENEKTKTLLASDLIVWYKNNRPDVLYVLNNLI